MSDDSRREETEREEAHHEEVELGKVYDGRLLLRLWPYIRPYRGQIAATLALFLPIFLLELAPAWVVKARKRDGLTGHWSASVCCHALC